MAYRGNYIFDEEDFINSDEGICRVCQTSYVINQGFWHEYGYWEDWDLEKNCACKGRQLREILGIDVYLDECGKNLMHLIGGYDLPFYFEEQDLIELSEDLERSFSQLYHHHRLSLRHLIINKYKERREEV